MELTCRECASKFRAAVQLPLTAPVRVVCPSCSHQMVLKPRSGVLPDRKAAVAQLVRPDSAKAGAQKKPVAVVTDEPRPFRAFLGEQLQILGFEVSFFETGDPALSFIRRSHADLVIVNVYLKGKLGVEVAEEIKADPDLVDTRVVLIGALFRANRFRANPTNLYGADEYIEEQIPEKEFQQIIRRLFPEMTPTLEAPIEPHDYEDARRLAKLILSDIIIYHAADVERGLRENTFFELLHDAIAEGRQYYESRVPLRIRNQTDLFDGTLEHFVELKREELARGSGTNG